MPPSRVADLLLRSPAPRRMRLHRPAAGPSAPGLVVLFTDGPTGALADRAGAVVLAGPVADPGPAHTALAWAADHAAELGADPARLALLAPAPLVDHLVRRIDEVGWPSPTVVVLVPAIDPADALLAAGWTR